MVHSLSLAKFTGLIAVFVAKIQYGNSAINDFKVGLRFCDGDYGDNQGDVEYSSWYSAATGAAGASDWASDDNFYDPDCGKIIIKGRDLSSLTDEFRIYEDIRLCIQASDHISGPTGTPKQTGDWQCTPWASAGGGWSDWANDANCYDPDAWRIRIDSKSRSDNKVTTDIKAAIQFTDDCDNEKKKGEARYTSWLIGSGEDTVASGWGGDSNTYDFDSIRIKLVTQDKAITSSPTKKPTCKPTSKPTDKPTAKPTDKPTKSPTRKPTWKPTDKPTKSPTRKPTWKPTDKPTAKPTESPTRKPTWKPTEKPTDSPTRKPTWKPTEKPTESPTRKPTWSPTEKPTESPTRKPTWSPTRKPTWSPSEQPTESPTRKPTWSPTETPSESPTRKPTWSPTRKPTWKPTEKPTRSPTTWTHKA